MYFFINYYISNYKILQFKLFGNRAGNNYFLLFVFLISIPIYVIICRNKFRYSPLLLSVIFLTIFVSIFLICIFPTINQKVGSSNFDLEEYIENNVKCAVYITDLEWLPWGSEYIYKRQIIPYMINNGSKNIDKPLQINIDCSSNNKFIFEAPDDNLNISYFSGSVKPWVFGDDYSVGIRWNDSYAGSPLPKKSSRWAVINCYSDEWLICNEFDYLDITIIMDDEYDLKITKMPCYADLPSGHLKEWIIAEVLEDIEYYSQFD